MPVDDDLDLSSLLRPFDPPPDGPRRARRTAHRRRLAHRTATAGLAVVVLAGGTLVVSRRESPSPSVTAGRPGATAVLAVTRAVAEDGTVTKAATLVDPASGATRPVDLPATDEDGTLGLLSRQGGIVVVERLPGSVWVLSSPYTGPPRRLGVARDVVPSVHPDRVWLVLEERADDGDGLPHTITATELDVRGRTVTPTVTFPCCRRLVADSSLGPVLQTNDGTVEVWDIAAGAPIRRFEDVGFVEAAGGDRLLLHGAESCEAAYGDTMFVLDVRTGSRRQVGGTCASFGTGEWSPDGRRVALWEPADGAAASLVLVDVDGEGEAPPVAVPASRSAEYLLAWDDEGRVYYVGDIHGESVRVFDPTTARSSIVFAGNGAGALVSALAVASIDSE